MVMVMRAQEDKYPEEIQARRVRAPSRGLCVQFRAGAIPMEPYNIHKERKYVKTIRQTKHTY